MSRVWSFIENVLAWTGGVFIVTGILTLVNIGIDARARQLEIQAKQAALELAVETCRANFEGEQSYELPPI